MPHVHTVVQGECLSVIAQRYGVSSARTLYEASENEALRRKRPDPNILFPGDQVVIPDKTTKQVEIPTGAWHRFVVDRPQRTRKLRLKLQDAAGEALASVPYRLELHTAGEPEVLDGQTTGDGVLEHEVSSAAQSVTLRIGRMVRRLQLGYLNPLREAPDAGVTGVQARLNNLGYGAGPVDGVLGPRTQAAIRAFQRDHEQPETGAIDEPLLGAIERQHEC